MLTDPRLTHYHDISNTTKNAQLSGNFLSHFVISLNWGWYALSLSELWAGKELQSLYDSA